MEESAYKMRKENVWLWCYYVFVGLDVFGMI